MRILFALALLGIGGCLVGCKACGEYRIKAIGSEIAIGPGPGQCVEFSLNQGLLDVFIQRLKPNAPQQTDVTPTGSVAIPNP